MPFALLIIGAVMLVAAVKNTQSNLATLVKGDFTTQNGQPSFIYWLVAIFLIGAVGYVPKLKPISTAFLGLVVLVLFLAKGNPGATGGGFFSQFTNALSSTTAPTSASVASTNTVIGPNSTALPPVTINPGVGGNTGSGYNSAFPALSNILDWLKVPGGPVPLPGTSTVQ